MIKVRRLEFEVFVKRVVLKYIDVWDMTLNGRYVVFTHLLYFRPVQVIVNLDTT